MVAQSERQASLRRQRWKHQIAGLLPAGIDDGQDRFHEPTSTGGLRAERELHR